MLIQVPFAFVPPTSAAGFTFANSHIHSSASDDDGLATESPDEKENGGDEEEEEEEGKRGMPLKREDIDH